VEPHTVPRELPNVEVIVKSSIPSAPDDAQYFLISVSNEGEDVTDFSLYYHLPELQDDVAVLVDGMTMLSTGTVIESIEPWTSYPFLVHVLRGSRFSRHNITFGVRSSCEENFIGQSLPHSFVAHKEIVLSVEWYEECPGLSLTARLRDTTDTPAVVIVSLENPTQVVEFVAINTHPLGSTLKELVNQSKIVDAHLQELRSILIGWQTCQDASTQAPVDFVSRESQFTRYSSYAWDFSGVEYDEKEISFIARAIVTCPRQFLNPDPTASYRVSESVAIRIDKKRPILIETLPIGGGHIPGSEPAAVFVFSEPIKCSPAPSFDTIVTIWAPGGTSPELFIQASDKNAHIAVTCSGSVISVSFVFSETPKLRTLTRLDLMGKRIVVQLQHVMDLAGNRAQPNVPQPDELAQEKWGQVEVSYEMMQLDVFTLPLLFEATYLIVPLESVQGGKETITNALIAHLNNSVDPMSISVTKIVQDYESTGEVVVTVSMRQNLQTIGAPSVVDMFSALVKQPGSGYRLSVGGRFDVMPLTEEAHLLMLQKEHRIMLQSLKQEIAQLGNATLRDLRALLQLAVGGNLTYAFGADAAAQENFKTELQNQIQTAVTNSAVSTAVGIAVGVTLCVLLIVGLVGWVIVRKYVRIPLMEGSSMVPPQSHHPAIVSTRVSLPPSFDNPGFKVEHRKTIEAFEVSQGV
jgi:hypothetical protein